MESRKKDVTAGCGLIRKSPLRVLTVFGTRPEAIKMAPVIQELRRNESLQTIVCVTGQHREMLDQVLTLFNIKPEFDINVMRSAQSLESVTAEILSRISNVIEEVKPDRVLVHGDTTTAFATALACFYKNIPIGHVEAGLRTGDLFSPWPEEMNRRYVDMVSDLMWAPTESARENLCREGVKADKIIVTGNTVIDALLHIQSLLAEDVNLRSAMDKKFGALDSSKKLILVTGHRRESFNSGLKEICSALVELARRPDVEIVWPVHLNPIVQGVVSTALSKHKNIHLIAPQDYLSFSDLMRRSAFIITDSGGIQEEAPTMNKPVLIARDVTERPEVIEVGAARLVGMTHESIVSGAIELLDNAQEYQRMANAPNPFGDGNASRKIVNSILETGQHNA